MALTLYSATVPSCQQILQAVSGLVDKAESHCNDKGIVHSELIQARLTSDMLPFAYQVKSTVVHSINSIEGVRNGIFVPDMTPAPDTFVALKARVADALASLAKIDAAEMESFIGRDMRFEMNGRSMLFTAENFLLSFSQPNFYFHATTAYDILRWKGVALGKRDFIGRLRLNKK